MTPDILLSRRLHIRGHNGKIYPYLVVNDSGLADARREERVLQLLRMLNHLLGKHKETSRRFLNMTVARVVAVSPQMRLVQVCRCQGTLTWKITLKSIFRTTRHQHPCWPFTKDVVLKGPQTNKTITSLLQGDNKHLCVHQLIKYLVLQKGQGMAMICFNFSGIMRSCHQCRHEAAKPHTRCSERFSRRSRAAWCQGRVLQALKPD